MNYAYLEDFVNYDDNGALNGDGSSSVDGAGGYAAAISAIEKLDGSAPIQTAGSNYLATQTFPVVEILGSCSQDTHTAMTTPTASNRPARRRGQQALRLWIWMAIDT